MTGPDPAHHVVLVGLMGAGKTTAGRRLARLIGRRFVDADDELEARSGRSIADWFERDGEAAFRRAEGELLADLLGSSDPLVIGAGGGVVVRSENRRLLTDGRATVVYLHGEPSFLVSRAEVRPHRPLLVGTDPHEVLEQMYEARDRHYRAVADAVVEVRPAPRVGSGARPRLERLIAGELGRLGVIEPLQEPSDQEDDEG